MEPEDPGMEPWERLGRTVGGAVRVLRDIATRIDSEKRRGAPENEVRQGWSTGVGLCAWDVEGIRTTLALHPLRRQGWKPLGGLGNVSSLRIGSVLASLACLKGTAIDRVGLCIAGAVDAQPVAPEGQVLLIVLDWAFVAPSVAQNCT